MIEKLLCKIGIHKPMKRIDVAFIDRVTGKSVYNAQCYCGIKWLTDGWFFRIRS